MLKITPDDRVYAKLKKKKKTNRDDCIPGLSTVFTIFSFSFTSFLPNSRMRASWPMMRHFAMRDNPSHPRNSVGRRVSYRSRREGMNSTDNTIDRAKSARSESQRVGTYVCVMSPRNCMTNIVRGGGNSLLRQEASFSFPNDPIFAVVCIGTPETDTFIPNTIRRTIFAIIIGSSSTFAQRAHSSALYEAP